MKGGLLLVFSDIKASLSQMRSFHEINILKYDVQNCHQNRRICIYISYHQFVSPSCRLSAHKRFFHHFPHGSSLHGKVSIVIFNEWKLILGLAHVCVWVSGSLSMSHKNFVISKILIGLFLIVRWLEILLGTSRYWTILTNIV